MNMIMVTVMVHGSWTHGLMVTGDGMGDGQ